MHVLFRLKRFSRGVLVVFSLLVLVISPARVFAQPSQALIETWRNADYGYNAVMMDIDPLNNIYVLGDNPASNTLNIKKFNRDGLLLWQVPYAFSQPLRGVWIASDGAGNAVVSANIIRALDGQPQGLLTLKLDPNGNLLWASDLPGLFSGAVRLEVDAANSIYVAGFTFTDALLVKYAPSGSALWSATFDNNGAIDQAYSMAISPDGGRIAVAGKSGNLFMGLMYDANGNRLWASTSTDVYPAGAVAFGPGDVTYFAAGVYLPQDPNPYQMAILKFGASGNQLWARNYGVGDRATRVAVDLLGNVVATGIDQRNGGYTDWMTIKTDSSGNLLWSQRFDGGSNNDEVPNMLELGQAGEVYIAGTGGPNPSTGTISNLKGVVVKYNADGTRAFALWDAYAGGKAVQLARVGLTQIIPPVVTLGFGYQVVARYTQSGLVDPVPAAPTSLTGAAGATDVTLNFSDNANNEFWVEVERCAGVGCSNFALIGQTRGEDATAYRDATVSGGTTYTYRVRAVGFMGASAYSNAASYTIAATPPAAPSNLVAQAVSKSQINLAWTNNSAGQTSVRIERCRGSGCTNYVVIATVAGSATSYSDSALAGNTVYQYRVSAVNGAGSSPYSNVAVARTLKK